jgi:hypothetical protein
VRGREGEASDLQVSDDGSDGLTYRLAGSGNGQGVLVDDGRAASAAALGSGGAQPVQGAFADEFAFHLGASEDGAANHLIVRTEWSDARRAANVPTQVQAG